MLRLSWRDLHCLCPRKDLYCLVLGTLVLRDQSRAVALGRWCCVATQLNCWNWRIPLTWKIQTFPQGPTPPNQFHSNIALTERYTSYIALWFPYNWRDFCGQTHAHVLVLTVFDLASALHSGIIQTHRNQRLHVSSHRNHCSVVSPLKNTSDHVAKSFRISQSKHNKSIQSNPRNYSERFWKMHEITKH